MKTNTITKTDSVKTSIGVEAKDRAEVAKALSQILASNYTLYLKSLNYHWNVTGPMFQTLHLMFETQYTELALAVDLIAERIRSLGFPAPGTYAQFVREVNRLGKNYRERVYREYLGIEPPAFAGDYLLK